MDDWNGHERRLQDSHIVEHRLRISNIEQDMGEIKESLKDMRTILSDLVNTKSEATATVKTLIYVASFLATIGGALTWIYSTFKPPKL